MPWADGWSIAVRLASLRLRHEGGQVSRRRCTILHYVQRACGVLAVLTYCVVVLCCDIDTYVCFISLVYSCI